MEEYFLVLVGGETRGRRWLRYLPQHTSSTKRVLDRRSRRPPGLLGPLIVTAARKIHVEHTPRAAHLPSRRVDHGVCIKSEPR